MPVHNVYPAGNVKIAGQIIHPADVLAGIGLVLAVEIKIPTALANSLIAQGKPIPVPVTGGALVDTGATSCCIEESIVQQLGLQVVGQTNVCGVGGLKLQNIYLAEMAFPGSPIPQMPLRLVGVQMPGTGIVSLIGRDILRHCVLVYNGPMGSYSISF